MAIKVGINGFGRIGRNIMRAALGDKKAAIIQDGLIALREQQMQKAAPRS